MKIPIALLAASLCIACGPKSEPDTAPRPGANTAGDQPAEGPTRPAERPPAKRAAPAPPPSRVGAPVFSFGKVDCQRMCSKTFIHCVGEVLVAAGKISAQKIADLRKAGVMHKVQQAGFKACMRDCAKKKGFGSDAVEINKCLAHTHCMKYAHCIKKHIK